MARIILLSFMTLDSWWFLSNHDLKRMCIEKRAFYRAVSGLHASINMHVSAIYPTEQTFPVQETVWGMNLERFKHYFSPEATNGQGL
jgi:hypothetical protein